MRRILTLILTLVAFNSFAQLRINDSTDTESFKILTGSTFRGTFPKGSAFIDVNASNQLGVRLLSGAQIANYNTFGNFIINGVTPSSFAQAHQLLSDVLGIQCCGSSGGSDTIVLDGNAFIVQGQNSAIQVDNTVEFDGEEIQFTGVTSTDTATGTNIYLGVATELLAQPTPIAQIANDSGTAVIFGLLDVNNKPLIAIGYNDDDVDYDMTFSYEGIKITGTLPETPLVIGNTGESILFGNEGNMVQEGSYSNSAIEINSAGGDDTIPSNTFTYLYNPASLQATATITLPLTPIDGQILHVVFGGTITSGAVVTTLTLAVGIYGINVGTAATTGTVEQPLTFQFVASLSKWYLISK